MVSARDLQKSVIDLQTTQPGPGLRKTAILAILCATLAYLALNAEREINFVFYSVLTAVFFAAWLITTHDAIHHTLTGLKYFDEFIPRAISFPIFWFHGTYSEIHKLHHKMNGDDVLDPERVQLTELEYEKAGKLKKFYARHQWFIEIFLFGGVGLILKTFFSALKFYRKSSSIRRQIALDCMGIIVTNVTIYAIAIANGAALKYFLFWLILERIGGGVLQWRAHVEHYGLWGKGHHYFETQAYNCRNIRTHKIVSWFFNHLNFHSVHHAFPKIPFYNLEKAHTRFMRLYGEGTSGLVVTNGYLSTAIQLAKTPTVISSIDPKSTHGARLMKPI